MERTQFSINFIILEILVRYYTGWWIVIQWLRGLRLSYFQLYLMNIYLLFFLKIYFSSCLEQVVLKSNCDSAADISLYQMEYKFWQCYSNTTHTEFVTPWVGKGWCEEKLAWWKFTVQSLALKLLRVHSCSSNVSFWYS